MLSVAGRPVSAGVPGQTKAHALLDVPYVSQTPELCGGAAVAMVLRYWGERGVFPEDFAPLVKAGDGGILTGALTTTVRDRGWQAFVVPPNDDTVHARIRSEIDRGRPLVALIDVGTRTYHYVVVVGSTDQDVVIHDPARAPFRVLPWAEFDRAWAVTGRWLMLVLPPAGIAAGDDAARVAPVLPDEAARSDQTPCDALVEQGVQMALSGDIEGAERALVAGTRLCPDHAASWRELAGWRFSQARWSEAQELALSAIRLAPDDVYAWQLVATARYLMGDLMGALDAWNHSSEPRLDSTTIHGAERTRQPVVVRAAGLQPRQVLTAAALGRALRRLRDVPVVSNARMKYEPIDGGLATLDVSIDERKMMPSGWLTFVAMGGRALLRKELRVDVAGPLGAGELTGVAWRWSSRRPLVAIGLAFPSPQWFSGVVSFDVSWERQSYDATPWAPAVSLVSQERRRIGLHVADWSSGSLRWQTGASFDRMREYGDGDRSVSGTREYLAIESALDVRLAGDRIALGVSAGWWASFGGGRRVGAGGLLAAWRSTSDPMAASWSAVTEVSLATAAAPLALWQGAGTGQGRSGLLRAHPLLNHDILRGSVFGREVARGSLEYARPVRRAFGGVIAIAGFVDSARAWHRLNGLDASPLYVDAGIGVRVRAPGLGGGIRIDVADGLRGGGGGLTLSAGWTAAWPR